MPHKPNNLKVNDLVIWHIKNNGVNQAMSGFVAEVLKVGESSALDLSKYDTTHYGPGNDIVRQGELRVLVRIPQMIGKPLLLIPDVHLLRLAGPPDRATANPADVLVAGKPLKVFSNGANATTVAVDGDKMIRNIKSITVDIEADEASKVTLVAYTPELELNGYIVSVEPFDPLAEEESE